MRLFKEARKDFHTLDEDDITIVHYSGDRINGHWGIEFEKPKGAEVPKDYESIHEPHPSQ